MKILFDLDGTMSDPREGFLASVRLALSSLGEPTPSDADLMRFIGPPLRDAFVQLLGGDNERADAAVQAYRGRFAEVGLFENTVYEGIPETLASLETLGADLYVATSKPEVYAERILVHFGLAGHFKGIFGSEFSGERADKGELIGHVLKTARLQPVDTVMIGDREHDILGAHRNRVGSVGVLWGFGSREELISAGAHRLCERPADLTALLGPSSTGVTHSEPRPTSV